MTALTILLGAAIVGAVAWFVREDRACRRDYDHMLSVRAAASRRWVTTGATAAAAPAPPAESAETCTNCDDGKRGER